MKSHTYTYDFAMVFCPRWDIARPWTAPVYLLEAVRAHGFSAQFLDYNVRLYGDNFTPELWIDNVQHQFWKTQPLDYMLDQIDLSEIDAAVVGFSLTDTNLPFSVELARRIRKSDPNKIIIFGGHRVFFEEEPDAQVPLDACDAIVKGEGELTLLDILQNGLNKNIGTYTPEGDHWVFNGDRELITDLDQFPWPRYEDVDWNLYPMREMNIVGSRGCIFRCAFCNDIIRARHRFRKRSPAHIAEEMLYNKAKNNVRFTCFNDSLVNADYRHLDELCDILLKRNFDRPWAANFSVRGNMPEELIRKAKRAGLSIVVLGLESGSPNVLKLMKKGCTVEEEEWFVNALHDAGIRMDITLIVGFPGETEQNFEETLAFLTKIAPKVWQVTSVATLNLDHSYIWDHLNEYGIVKLEKDRHISWYTKDGLNTYDVRLKRAERLVNHARSLGLTHYLYDVAIEKKDQLLTMDVVRRNRRIAHTKHRIKNVLRGAHLLRPAQRVAAVLRRG
ncbi:MAG: radical SAM protein [Candidatus Hydrogenedentes bacterium]|nr:radical SAM protein [Candidatus Hydrogenedentota bacterium]